MYQKHPSSFKTLILH